MKALIINFKLLSELKIDLTSFLYLYHLYNKGKVFNIIHSEAQLNKLQNDRLIKRTRDKVTLRQEAIDLIELLIIDSDTTIKEGKLEIRKSTRVINKSIEDNIKAYRDLWRGLKPGSMGSLQSCKSKMARWMKSNPEYSFDDIIKAAKLYLSTEGRNIRFLQRADYFIYKQSNNREEESRLSAYIDDTIDDEDWTTTLN